MRKMIRSAALISVFALPAAGCGDDGGGGGDRQPRDANPSATLSSGIYEISDADMHSDGCDLGSASDLNGASVTVTVSGSTVTIGSVDTTLSNGNITGSLNSPGEDVFGDGSCLVDFLTEEDGTVPENNQIDVVESVTVSNPVGQGCSQIPVNLPCTSTYFVRLTAQQ